MSLSLTGCPKAGVLDLQMQCLDRQGSTQRRDRCNRDEWAGACVLWKDARNAFVMLAAVEAL